LGEDINLLVVSALKFLHEFPDAVFLGVDVESILVEVEVSALET